MKFLRKIKVESKIESRQTMIEKIIKLQLEAHEEDPAAYAEYLLEMLLEKFTDKELKDEIKELES